MRDIEIEPSVTYPKMKKLRDGRLMIDGYADGDRIMIRAWRRGDNPELANLRALWPHLPRAVLAPFRAENQLRMMRAVDQSGYVLLDEAEQAWAEYHIKRANQVAR